VEVLASGGTDIKADVDLAIDLIYALSNLLFTNYNNIINVATYSSSDCLGVYMTTAVPDSYVNSNSGYFDRLNVIYPGKLISD
jgi:hypothetical protein